MAAESRKKAEQSSLLDEFFGTLEQENALFCGWKINKKTDEREKLDRNPEICFIAQVLLQFENNNVKLNNFYYVTIETII